MSGSRPVLLLACLAAAAALLWRLFAPGTPPPGPPSYAALPVPVRIAQAQEASLGVDIHALGTVTPLARVELRPQVDGELLRLHYAEGQAVARGQLLAEIDPRPYRIALLAAEGELARTLALQENAEAELRRYQRLARQEAVSAQRLDEARTQAERYAAQRRRDEARVADARRQLEYTRIVAPQDGRIGLRRTDAGNQVRADDPLGLATLVQTAPISVLFSVPETRLDLLRRAQAGGARLRVQAWDADDRRLLAEGDLQALDNRIAAGSGTVALRARFDNADEALFPNQFVNVRLTLAQDEAAVTIPSVAVQYGPAGPYAFVVGPDLKARRRVLQLGRASRGRVAVETGVASAEQVVVEGIDRLREGRDVVIVDRQG